MKRIVFIIVCSITILCTEHIQAQVTAKNDTLYVSKGGVCEIDVLLNDAGTNLQQPVILTQPTGGTVINSAINKLAFTPNPGYDGTDSCTYRVCDNQNNCADATVIIIKMPDNFILTSSCSAALPITTWSIREAWRQQTGGTNDDLSSPSVGDLDGDGIAEVVNFSGTTSGYNFQSGTLQVRRGTDGHLLSSVGCYMSHNGLNMPTLVDLNKDGKSEILVFNSSYNLIALTFTRTSTSAGTLTQYKTSSIAVTSDVANSYNVGVYDLNGDGRTEVLVGPYIFNDNLVLIAQNSNVTAGTGFVSQCIARKAIAADIDNNGKMEIIAGNYTFSVNISNPDASSGNSITQLAYSGQNDGFSAVADIDLDGDIDVVVVGTQQTYVWDGATNAFMGGETHSTNYWVSTPLIADVDNDGQLEIIYNRSNATQCLRYNNGGNLATPWSMVSSDIGGGTYMTAFDFNNDGSSEMVYREDGGLHIIDGITQQHITISLSAGTIIDGPIIADADGDGEAEILVIGKISNNCYIYCFKSNGQPWLYARPVWNQYMYSGIHINDNLTVPPHPVNPAQTVFQSGKRPLNNFLQQHSLIDIKTGELVSVTLSTDLTILSANILSLTSSQLTVEVKVLNLENAVALANIPIALSIENSGNYVFVNSQNITTNIAPGTIKTDTLTFNISSQMTSNYRLTVNANSATFPNAELQTECNYTNNVFDISLSLMLNPLSEKYIACHGAVVSMGFSPISGFEYYWYNIETGGTAISSGNPANTLTVIKGSADDIGTWWVEPRSDNIIFPRYRVDLELGNCGVINPQGCAEKGTILFREDFDSYGDGLNPLSPQVSSEALPMGRTTHNFVSSEYPNDGSYTLIKFAHMWDGPWGWNIHNDYNLLNDSTVGRFMLINADYTPKTFYRQTIDKLCSGYQLYFSAMVANCHLETYSGLKPNLSYFLLDTVTDKVIASFHTGDIPDATHSIDWRQWGFHFLIPENTNSLVLEIKNNQVGGGGNDLGLDNIEIRLCVSPVTLTQPINLDTTLCLGSSLTLSGNYADDGTFANNGSNLVYRWERNITGDINNPNDWTLITGTQGTSATDSVTSVYTIDAITKAEEGYYRMVVANQENINNYNCRSMSDIIHLHVIETTTISDTITADQTICYNTSPTTLTSTKDTNNNVSLSCQWQQSADSIMWTNVTNGSGSTTLNYSPPALTQTTFYRLQIIENTSSCGTKYSNVVKITVISNPIIDNNLPDYVICDGEQTSEIIFTGAFTAYEWKMNDNSIQGFPSGTQTGNFGVYTLENKTSTPLEATIIITPYYVNNGLNCKGDDTSFHIVVNPISSISNILVNDTLCNGEKTAPIIFTGIATDYEWIASGTISGLPQNTQTGNFGAYTLSNTTSYPLHSVITVTPKYSGGGIVCFGASQQFEIIVNPHTTVEPLTANALFLCEGSALTIEAKASGENLSYQWYKEGVAIVGEVNQYYTVSVTSKANSGVYYVEVTGACGEVKSPSIIIDVMRENILIEKWNDVILVDNSTYEFCEYQWYKDGNIIYGAKEQFYQEIGGLKGCYSVELTLVKGSKIHSCERCVDKKQKKIFSVYPNPAPIGMRIHILLPEDNVDDYTTNVELYTMDGKQVSKRQINQNVFELETHTLSAGIYILKLNTVNGRVYIEKIILY